MGRVNTAVPEEHCLRHTELPGCSRLFADLLYDFSRVAQFYDYDPSSPDALLTSAITLDFPDERREAITRILRRQNGNVPSLDLLSRPGAVAILTGQQVGLFGGPCYTVYKALTALALARSLRDDGVTAVPVFWMATEDHDFAEVNHCWVFDKRNSPVRLETGESAIENVPVGDLPVGHAPLDELHAALDGFEHVDEVMRLVADSYGPDRTFGAAFRTLLKETLREEDLLFFDPMDSAAREAAAPLMARAVRECSALTDAVQHRNRELQQAGYHQQVRVAEQSCLFFLLHGGRRVALRQDGDGYVGGDRRFASEELAALGQELSPSALLRPVVQDYLFPTAAYVGGPAELSYFAQNQVVYRTLGVRPPMVVPRVSATILDARTQDLLTQNGLRLPDLFRGQERVKEQVAAKLMPAPLSKEVGETRLAIARLFERAAVVGSEGGRGMRSLAKSRSKIEYQLARVERKIALENIQADEQAARAITEACNLAYPAGNMQERFYALLPFLARYGFDLVGCFKKALASADAGHRLLVP